MFWIDPTMGCTRVLSQVQSISSPAPSSRPYFVTGCHINAKSTSARRSMGQRNICIRWWNKSHLGNTLRSTWWTLVGQGAVTPKSKHVWVCSTPQTDYKSTGWGLLLVIPKKTRSQKGALQDSTEMSFLLLSRTESLQNCAELGTTEVL